MASIPSKHSNFRLLSRTQRWIRSVVLQYTAQLTCVDCSLALPASPSSFKALTPPGCSNSPTMRSGSAKSRSTVQGQSKETTPLVLYIPTSISFSCFYLSAYGHQGGVVISPTLPFSYFPLLPDQPYTSSRNCGLMRKIASHSKKNTANTPK